MRDTYQLRLAGDQLYQPGPHRFTDTEPPGGAPSWAPAPSEPIGRAMRDVFWLKSLLAAAGVLAASEQAAPPSPPCVDDPTYFQQVRATECRTSSAGQLLLSSS